MAENNKALILYYSNFYYIFHYDALPLKKGDSKAFFISGIFFLTFFKTGNKKPPVSLEQATALSFLFKCRRWVMVRQARFARFVIN